MKGWTLSKFWTELPCNERMDIIKVLTELPCSERIDIIKVLDRIALQ